MDPDFLTTHGSISCRTLIDHFFRDRHFGYIKGGFWLAHRKDFVENWNCAYNLFEGHEHYTNSFLRWRFLWKYYGTQAKGTDLDTSREKFATPSSGSVAYLLRYPRTVCSQCVVHRLWTDPVQGFFFWKFGQSDVFSLVGPRVWVRVRDPDYGRPLWSKFPLLFMFSCVKWKMKNKTFNLLWININAVWYV